LTHSRRRLASIAIAFDEALDALSAEHGDYALSLGVRSRKRVVFRRIVGIKSVNYDRNAHTVTINLARPATGPVQVIVPGSIAAANGATGGGDFTAVVT
jgi:hypothetical protein